MGKRVNYKKQEIRDMEDINFNAYSAKMPITHTHMIQWSAVRVFASFYYCRYLCGVKQLQKAIISEIAIK